MSSEGLAPGRPDAAPFGTEAGRAFHQARIGKFALAASFLSGFFLVSGSIVALAFVPELTLSKLILSPGTYLHFAALLVTSGMWLATRTGVRSELALNAVDLVGSALRRSLLEPRDDEPRRPRRGRDAHHEPEGGTNLHDAVEEGRRAHVRGAVREGAGGGSHCDWRAPKAAARAQRQGRPCLGARRRARDDWPYATRSAVKSGGFLFLLLLSACHAKPDIGREKPAQPSATPSAASRVDGPFVTEADAIAQVKKLPEIQSSPIRSIPKRTPKASGAR